MKQLEVGDVLYSNNSSGFRRITIASVTPKQAKSKTGIILDRQPVSGGYYNQRGAHYYWHHETEDFKQKWELAQTRSLFTQMVEDSKYSTPLNKMKRIIDILNEKV